MRAVASRFDIPRADSPVPIEGFARVEPFEVDVRRGETITRTIALQRAP
jgi:hypothetical protein